MSKGMGLAIAFLHLWLAAGAGSQLSGRYTLDPQGSGPRNFKTFGAAAAALTSGVTGPVDFAVASTTFREAVSLPPVPGTSKERTVTFAAVGPPAVIETTGADGLHLQNDVCFYRFDNFEIKGFTSNGIFLDGLWHANYPNRRFCNWNDFRNIVVNGPATASTQVAALNVRASEDNTFLNCTFRGGGCVVLLYYTKRISFDRCEVDGLGKAGYLFWPQNTGDNDSDCLLENSFFHGSGPAGEGVYVNSGAYSIMFWHNTVIVNSTQPAVLMGSCCMWSRANSFRDNIIVNLGSGSAVAYEYHPGYGQLLYNDADYNCYYAPHTTVGTCKLERGSFRGSLAAWKAYLKNNPSLIPPGGGKAWDQNSIETDPGLVSLTGPVDPHLKATSPCIDAGTTQYVAGSWISFPSTATVPFDFEGESRGARVDIGADELAPRITGSGPTSPGSILVLGLAAPTDAGLSFQVGSALGTGPIPIGKRQVNLSLDGLLAISVIGYWPGVFAGYRGVIDSKGQAQAAIHIPNVPALIGLRLHSAFVTLDPAAPSGVRSISNTFSFSITK